jgi:hypothetical protein
MGSLAYGLYQWKFIRNDPALCFLLQATIGIDFLSKTMYLEDRTVSTRIILIVAAII